MLRKNNNENNTSEVTAKIINQQKFNKNKHQHLKRIQFRKQLLTFLQLQLRKNRNKINSILIKLIKVKIRRAQISFRLTHLHKIITPDLSICSTSQTVVHFLSHQLNPPHQSKILILTLSQHLQQEQMQRIATNRIYKVFSNFEKIRNIEHLIIF